MTNRILLFLALILQFSMANETHAQEVLIGRLRLDRWSTAPEVERILKLARLGFLTPRFNTDGSRLNLYRITLRQEFETHREIVNFSKGMYENYQRFKDPNSHVSKIYANHAPGISLDLHKYSFKRSQANIGRTELWASPTQLDTLIQLVSDIYSDASYRLSKGI